VSPEEPRAVLPPESCRHAKARGETLTCAQAFACARSLAHVYAHAQAFGQAINRAQALDRSNILGQAHARLRAHLRARGPDRARARAFSCAGRLCSLARRRAPFRGAELPARICSRWPLVSPSARRPAQARVPSRAVPRLGSERAGHAAHPQQAPHRVAPCRAHLSGWAAEQGATVAGHRPRRLFFGLQGPDRDCASRPASASFFPGGGGAGHSQGHLHRCRVAAAAATDANGLALRTARQRVPLDLRANVVLRAAGRVAA
jgi:hypothetical protein